MFITDKGYMFNTTNSTLYWSNKTKIEYLERKLIIYCISYYELNDTLTDDNTYNIISKQLERYINKYPKTFKKTKYYYVFKDFISSTGFDIVTKLNKTDKKYLYGITAYMLERKHKSET